MNIPFTIEEFLKVFARYNAAVFPMQIFFMLLGVAAMLFAFVNKEMGYRGAIFIVAALWLWMGTVYHIGFFAQVNPAARVFGVLFILESIFLLRFGTRISHPVSVTIGWSTIGGTTLMLFAFIVYPVISLLLGHSYPHMPTFGVPCPTTIFTFGIFLLLPYRTPFYVYFIPVAWSAVGIVAALQLRMFEDVALFLAALLFIVLNLRKHNSPALSNQASSTQYLNL